MGGPEKPFWGGTSPDIRSEILFYGAVKHYFGLYNYDDTVNQSSNHHIVAV